nr:MAG TPA: hypothetical protein [Caudoviricetes sp.]
MEIKHKKRSPAIKLGLGNKYEKYSSIVSISFYSHSVKYLSSIHWSESL